MNKRILIGRGGILGKRKVFIGRVLNLKLRKSRRNEI